MRGITHFWVINFFAESLNSTIVMRDTAHFQILIHIFVKRPHWEWLVLQFTLLDKSDEVEFSCSEVRCVIAHFWMIFQFMESSA